MGLGFVDWLRSVDDSLVEVVYDSRVATSIDGVSGAVVVESVVNIRGLTLAGLRIPTLRSVPVLRDFPGLLLGNAFNKGVGANYDYATMQLGIRCNGQSVYTPFRVSNADERSVALPPFTSATLPAAVPVVYSPSPHRSTASPI